MPFPVPTLELVSVHVPKWAGNSRGAALGGVFSARLLHDAEDRPDEPASPINLDLDGFFQRAHAALPILLQSKPAVHRYFHPGKYEPAPAGQQKFAQRGSGPVLRARLTDLLTDGSCFYQSARNRRA